MLALVVSLLLALYILGPDLFSRLVLGFIVPRRAVTLTRGEEVSRAVVWCIGPLLLATLWAHLWGSLPRLWDWQALKLCLSGIYSEQTFREQQGQWFHAANRVAWINFILLWRVYTLVLLLTLSFDLAILKYAWLWRRTEKHPRLQQLLASIVLPRVAPWHVLLSGMLLPDKHLRLRVDVLTRSGMLYTGILTDRQLAADGSLVSITLEEPSRFQRERYLQQQAIPQAGPDSTAPPLTASSFWKPIPTNLFILLGSDIANLNLRYVPDKNESLQDHAVQDALKRVNASLRELEQQLNADREG